MADLLLTHGTIHTLDEARPQANAMAFVDGRVAAFDDEANALRTLRTEVVDLRGRTCIPGMVDHHIHFTDYALGLARVQLEGARSLEETVARIAARVQKAKPGEWILGMRWNHRDWERPEFPSKEPLDRIAPANPVALERKDKHSIWLNSAALRAANIARETPDPAGGVVERDASGEPTGLLREQAVRLAEKAIGPAAGRLSDDELQAAISSAHRLGLTGIHNVEGADALRAFEHLRARDRLTLRVTHMIPAENLAHAVALGLETGFGDEFLRIGGVKIFADGSLGSQTAHMLEPYAGQPENCGMAVTPPAEIERLARMAANAGLIVATHAIGDRANRDVLDVYEKLRREGVEVTLRVEHAQHLHPTDIARFGALQVVASVQPIHPTSDYIMADQLLGPRARYAYAFKSLLMAGARLIFGSDCPVETLDPFAGLHAAVTRERVSGEPRGGWYPAERLAVEEALRAFADPLRIGEPADCVILSADVFSVPPQHLLETRVDQTIVGGKIVYSG
jgi:hypothetical protein